MTARTKEDRETKKSRREEKKRNGVPFWKLLAWSTRGGSTGIASMIMGYLTIFCTDTLGVPPATVGFLLLAVNAGRKGPLAAAPKGPFLVI